MSYLDEQDKRIAEILGSEEPLKVDDKTLAKYLVYRFDIKCFMWSVMHSSKT